MEYSSSAVLDFLVHAAERGMMPSATAVALAVACRNVFEILEPSEAVDLRGVDLDRVVARFVNKRADDFNPSSLREYGRRVKRAWELFSDWKRDPASFAPKTRATAGKKTAGRSDRWAGEPAPPMTTSPSPTVTHVRESYAPNEGTYSTSVLIRRGHIVTLSNLPTDLTDDEAERLAAFARMLGTGG
jgi:hypothetical protein